MTIDTSRTGTLAIEGRAVGGGARCFLVAEIAQAHDGSLGTAHAYIDAVAGAGADAIKFQTHIAVAESTPREEFRVKCFRQDASRYDYWKRMEFTHEQWEGLAGHARDIGLVFLSTPFSDAAVELLERLDVPAWKVGSGETTNLPLVRRMARTRRPVLLSTGLATWADLDAATRIVRDEGAPLAVFQCTTAYPCPPEKLGLNVLEELRARYGVPVGLSDHSGTIASGLGAAALGADLLEVHVVFSRQCFGPDVVASVTTTELRTLADGLAFLGRARANPVDKERAAAELGELRRVFGKSVVAARDLPAGHELAPDDLALKKPGTGLPPAQLDELVGRRLRDPVAADAMFRETDLV